MYSELKRHLAKEVNFYDCKLKLQYERELLKALMCDLNLGTLFISYNSFLDDLQAFSSDANCADELICLCNECNSKSDD